MKDELRKLEASGDWKTSLFRYGIALIAFETATGVYLLLVRDWTSVGMMLLLGHIGLGFAMAAPVVMFAIRHARYRRIWDDRRFRFLGAATAAALAFSFASGVRLTVDGVTGHRALWWLHDIASFAGALGICLYVAAVLRRAIELFGAGSRVFVLRVAARTAAVAAAVAAAALLVCAAAGRIFRDRPARIAPAGYRYPFEGQSPFFPALLSTPDARMLNPALFMNSRSCGTAGCHADILKQWQQSVHYRTPNYFVLKSVGRMYEEASAQKTLTRSDHPYFKKLRAADPGPEMARFCAGCHAPVALLSGAVTQGKPLRDYHEFEGDSCVLCHSISSYNMPGHVQDFVVTAPPRYLFWDSRSPLGEALYKTLIRTKPEFHKKAFMNPGYKTAEYCATCHRPLQYASWVAGPYHDAANPQKSRPCQSCHMPEVKADDEVSARVKGTTTDHRFLSEGFTMAQVYGVPEQYERTRKFLQDRKMSVAALAPATAAGARKLRFTVRIENIGVGHMFPAGVEGDLVEAWTEVAVKDDAGRTIFQYGMPGRDGLLDARTHVYRVLPFDSDGRPLDLEYHRSWRFAKDVMDTIPPRQYDDVPFEVAVPPLAKGRRLTISARLRYRKPNQRYMDFVFGKGKARAPIVDVATGTAVVGIETDPAAVAAARAEWEKELATAPAGLTKRTITDPLPYTTRVDVESTVMLGEIHVLRASGERRDARLMFEELPGYVRQMVERKRQAKKIAAQK